MILQNVSRIILFLAKFRNMFYYQNQLIAKELEIKAEVNTSINASILSTLKMGNNAM